MSLIGGLNRIELESYQFMVWFIKIVDT